MPNTKPVLRIPERTIPSQDIEITNFSYRNNGEISVALSDHQTINLTPDVETRAYLNHLYMRIASEKRELNATKEDVPVVAAEAAEDAAAEDVES